MWRAEFMGCQRGFSLLEMMVVVAVIARLAGILIPNFSGGLWRRVSTGLIMDLTSAALRAVGSGTAWAPAFAFAAGAAGSAGPCVAPRFVAIAAFTLNRPFRDSALMTTSFVAGHVATYVLF